MDLNDDNQNNLTDQSSRPSAERIAAVESGLNGQKIQIGFGDVLRNAGNGADLIMIGDTGHNDPSIRGLAMQKDNLVALAEAGVSHLFVEVDHTLQPIADKLVANKDKVEFGTAFNQEYGNAIGNETGAYTRQLSETILTADRLGIKVHFANPNNGWQEREEAERYADQHPNDTAGIDAKYDKVYQARFDDRQLASFINTTSNGEKSAMIYGSSHGSRKNDLEEFYDGKSVKIDVYRDQSHYNERVEEMANDPMAQKMKFNEDKPGLVYFKNEGIAATTVNTPKELDSDLKSVGALVTPTSESRDASTSPAIQQRNNSQSLSR